LSDESFLYNAKPKAVRAAPCKNSLRTRSNLSTGEVALSAGKDKRENFKRLLPYRTAVGKTGAAGKPAAPLFIVTETETECLPIAQAGADIELKNSMLALDFDSRLIKSSMASTVESGLKTLRSTQTRLNSSGGRSSSSLRVPER
jgi:hypothetical protein